MRTLLLIGSLVALSGSVAAEDFIVDAGGGPGADFTNLPAAVASPLVQDGDRLLVRPGQYTGFSTDKALSIFKPGAGKVIVTGEATFQNLASSAWATLEGIRVPGLVIDNCTATVFVRDCRLATVRISNGSDVRIADSRVVAPTGSWDGEHAVLLTGSSSVELVACYLRGGRGVDAGLETAGFGGHGVFVQDTSVVHIALSDIFGGDGGDQTYPEWGDVAGDGGNGIQVQGPAQALVTGIPENWIRGGVGGQDAWGWGNDGYDGIGLRNLGAARVSGVKVVGISGPGYLELPTPADPSMAWTILSGGRVRVQVHGAVGASVRLHLGSEPLMDTAGFLEKPAMNEAMWTSWVGVIGSSGSITHVFPGTIPIHQGQRYLAVFQGSAFVGGKNYLTNSGNLTRPGQ